MKTFLRYCLASIFAVCLLANTGCTSLFKVESGNPTVVLAEKSIKITTYTFDTFFKLERANRDQLLKLDPKIHAYAQEMRIRVPNYIKSANTVLRAYKYGKKDTDLAILKTDMALLTTITEEVGKYLLQIEGNK